MSAHDLLMSEAVLCEDGCSAGSAWLLPAAAVKGASYLGCGLPIQRLPPMPFHLHVSGSCDIWGGGEVSAVFCLCWSGRAKCCIAIPEGSLLTLMHQDWIWAPSHQLQNIASPTLRAGLGPYIVLESGEPFEMCFLVCVTFHVNVSEICHLICKDF